MRGREGGGPVWPTSSQEMLEVVLSSAEQAVKCTSRKGAHLVGAVQVAAQYRGLLLPQPPHVPRKGGVPLVNPIVQPLQAVPCAWDHSCDAWMRDIARQHTCGAVT